MIDVLRGRFALLLVCGLFEVATVPCHAQPFPRKDLPPDLQPWVGWVLDGAPELGCPRVDGTPVCAWPGVLKLDLTPAGGGFQIEAHADRALDFRLPGDVARWPQAVRVDGQPAAVVEAQGLPSVRLAIGAHRIEGRFGWGHLPDSLPVPVGIGVVDLTLSGRAVPLPQRDEAGLLWLRKEGAADATAGESLRLQVFRKLSDGIPLWIETQLALEVSGKAREIELQGALIEGASAVAVGGELPARLDKAGRLRVQVRAGRFGVSVLCRIDGDVHRLGLAAATPPWPEREIWVFQAAESLRQLELSGPSAVDPSRTDLPEAWRALPAYLIDARAALELKELRRGESEAPPDAVALERELWLDQAGDALTVRDTFSGTLHRTWRLDLAQPATLGRVALDGSDQLVTANPDPKAPLSGVEIRKAALALVADSRLPRSGSALPAVGWTVDVERLSASLHLPPGWWVLGASGVDSLPGSWTTRWTLMGFFFVLLVAFSVARLVGWREGALALLAMGLSYKEDGAPFLIWLSLLGALALLRVVPDGRLQVLVRLWWWGSAIGLGLGLAAFFLGQIRLGLYPQLGEVAVDSATFDERGAAGGAPIAMAPPPPAKAAAPEPEQEQTNAPPQRALKHKGRVDDTSNTYLTSVWNQALEQDPKAVLQTGPGVPSWRWKTYQLGWSGPVEKTHTMRLLLVSPGMNRLVTLLRLGLLGWLAVCLLGLPRRATPPAPQPEVAPMPGPPVGPPVTAALALAVCLLAAMAHAQDPPPQNQKVPAPQLLEELKQRLTRPEACQPHCLTTARVDLRIAGEQLTFVAEVHAQAPGAWPVPGPVSSWVPRSVRVDGQSSAALARLPDGFLHVRLGPGLHTVEVVGPLPAADSLTLQFRERPKRAHADAPGFEVTGIREDGPADESIQLTRRLDAPRGASDVAATYAPWLEVTRTLQIGVSWRIETQVRRVSPSGTPIAVRIPLLPGESITEGDFEAEKGEAVVSFSRDQMEARWASTLTPGPKLSLEAPAGRPWSEVWRIQCSVVWECAPSGIAPIRQQREGMFEPEYRPWPGERVAIAFAHPQGVAGQTLTLDEVELDATPGVRLEAVTLELAARSSREDALNLTLPPGASVQEVKVGDATRPVRPEGERLRVTLPAGRSQVKVTWHQPREMGLRYAAPVVGLPLPAVNATVRLHLPENRLLLWTSGPAWGPAVLFWGYLLFVVAAALAVSRVPDTPLSRAQWLLLLLGLTQIPVAAALVVIGYFLVMRWRQRSPRPTALGHDALQLGLLVWTLAALLCLFGAVWTGLVLRPDMQVAGNGSSAGQLNWFADRVADATPAVVVWSVPLWLYKGAMLLWALWLAQSLVRWLGWAWHCFSGGGLWRPLARTRGPVVAASSTPRAPGAIPNSDAAQP